MTTKDQQEKIQQLQLIEQNLQNLLAQKQQFQSQMFELDGALKEIDASPQVYKIVGGIMVLTEKEKLKKDLSEKKELVELRISSIEKQEKQFKDKAKTIQEEVLALMKEKK